VSFIRIVDEAEAKGTVAEDYAYLEDSYSNLFGPGTPTPNMYRTNTVIPAYFRFGAVQNRVLTNDGNFGDEASEQEPVPGILVMFAVSMYSSCFY
jgi:hypothetical protein